MFYWDQLFPVGWDFSCSDSLEKERILIGLVDHLFLTSSELELEPSIGNLNQINQNQRFDWLFVLRIAYFPYYIFLGKQLLLNEKINALEE